MRVLIYTAILILVSAYAALRGGRPERIGAAILFVGSFLTLAAYSPAASRFGAMELRVLAVDVLALLGFVILALRSDRFWPLWVAALQLIGTLGHAARLLEPGMLPTGYAFILAVWSYPMLAIIAAAVWQRDRRRSRAQSSSRRS